MSINDAILSKRGPLARVWLAATLERKVSKQNFLAASIPQSVEAIVGDATMVPIALRLSGQLLLGVARMYSRKAKYLMDDATETLSKVRLAFRAAGSNSREVDMAADQQTASRNAITLQENEFDSIYQEMMNMNWEDVLQAELAATSTFRDAQQPKRKRTTATNEEITLPDHEFDFEAGAGAGVYDLDLDFAGRGIDSQQFASEDFNLDLDLDMPLPHEQEQLDRQSQRAPSVEMGRDAPSSAARKSNRGSSPRSQLDGGFGMDLDLDDAPLADDSAAAAAADASGFDAGGADFQFEAGADFDLKLDMGDVSGAAHDDRADGQATPRAGTPTGKPSDQDQSAQEEQENVDGETTPQADKTKKRRTKAVQKQIVDSVTELQSPSRRGQHSQNTDDAAQTKKSALISPPQFLPRDPHRLALMSLDINSYLPMLDASKQFVGLPAAAGTGFLAPELQELFKFDVGSKKRDSDNADAASRKRQRTAEPEHEEGRVPSPELGRRQSLPPLSDAGNDFEAGAGPASDFPDLDVTMQDDMAAGADFSNMHDDFRFELESQKSGGREHTPGSQRARSRSASVFSARSGVSRRSQYLVEEDTMPRGDASSLLAPFDDLRLATSTAASASSRSVSKSPSKHASQQAAAQAEEETVLQGKWSKSSRVAIQILNGELAPGAEESAASEEKKLSFEHAADKGSRRAAASFFFELLVLSSRNCVKVNQSTPYGDMQISGTPALFEAAANLPPVSMGQQDVAAGSSQPPSRAASLAPSSA